MKRTSKLDQARERIARVLAGESRYTVYECGEAGNLMFLNEREREDLLAIARAALKAKPRRDEC